MQRVKSFLNKKRRLAVVGLLVALVAAGGFWYWGSGASAAEYMTARVERGNLRNTVTATGTLQAVTTVQVGSQASGTISALYADFNSTVKKGQLLAQLDPSVMQAQVQQARANLAQATAQLQQALNELDETFRTPIILFYFDEFSYRDIAEQMELPIGTVMSRLARAKAYLRNRLAPAKGDANGPHEEKAATGPKKVTDGVP